MTFLSRIYLHSHRRMVAQPGLTLAGFVLVWLLLCAGLIRLPVDFSFRPLFTAGAEDLGPTRDFEAEFGQLSGAYALYMLEHPEILSPPFLEQLAQLSGQMAAVDGVAEVISLATLRLPQPDSADPTGLRPRKPSRSELSDSRLLSRDGSATLVLVRLAAPMAALDERRKVLRQLQVVASDFAPHQARWYRSGVSVVEAAYAETILPDQILATGLTLVALVLLLGCMLGSAVSVTACLLPTLTAVPMTLGLMGWLDLPVTVINSVIPAVILVIGVADAVHMVIAWQKRNCNGESGGLDIMLARTGAACALTTLTTAAGFLALSAARLDVIREFGLAVAAGVVLAWFANQILVPQILGRWPMTTAPRRGRCNGWLDRAQDSLFSLAIDRPRLVVLITLLLVPPATWLATQIEVDQKFNEELPPAHRIRIDQQLMEQHFGGFLGPELEIHRADGGDLLDPVSLGRLDTLLAKLAAIPETGHISSLREILPAGLDGEAARSFLATLRRQAAFSSAVRERINTDNTRLALQLRIADLGTVGAANYRDRVMTLAADSLGRDYPVRLVGQWWLAQQGMRLILGDMLRSLLTALLVVMPILWLSLRNWRLFTVATIANLLPLLAPLAFMALTGIGLRIGTAVVLAIVLGIAVDNTLHIIKRLQAFSTTGTEASAGINAMMRGTGRAVICTSIALIAGFLTMLTNNLLVIRDMGLVAAVAFAAALLADLVLLPALYLLFERRFPVAGSSAKSESAPST